MAGDGWADHSRAFLTKWPHSMVRMPGARRHNNRQDTGARQINTSLVETIRGLS